MTATKLSPSADAPLAGWRGWSVRSALAPAPFSRRLPAGAAAVAVLAALDVLAGAEILLRGLLLLPPPLGAPRGRWGGTPGVSPLPPRGVLPPPPHPEGMPAP